MIELNQVSYRYSVVDNYALKDISLRANDGQIVLCTGRSGCGKTTLVRLLNGLCPNYYGGIVEGKCFINQNEITKECDIATISQMVGTLFQDPNKQFFAMNVEDEIAFALEWLGLSRDEIHQKVQNAIGLLGLESVKDQEITALSEGQKQKVGIASLLALGVKNLILDEPSANLDVKSTLDLATTLENLRSKGYCILVVDHRLYYLKDIADKVYVLDEGKIRAQGDFSILYDDNLRCKYGLRKSVIDDPNSLFLKICNRGHSKDNSKSLNNDSCVVTGQEISFAYKNGKQVFDKFNFALDKGVTLLLGENGVGKTTLFRLLFGLEKANKGKIKYQKSNDRYQNLCSIVLQNADYQLHMQTVKDEIKTSLALANKEAEDEHIDEILERFSLREFKYRHPQSLSGGQKQRLSIASALCKDPLLLILDEPTSGLDGQNLQKIKQLLADFTKDNKAAVVITHDLELMDEAYNVLHLTKQEN